MIMKSIMKLQLLDRDQNRAHCDESVTTTTTSYAHSNNGVLICFLQALNLRQMTDEMEDKEETLVMDCIEQLGMSLLLSSVKSLASLSISSGVFHAHKYQIIYILCRYCP